MKPALKELQQAFKHYLIKHDLPQELPHEPEIAQHIVGTQKLANDARLAIYSNAYRARLVESLEQDYEAIHALLGDDEFTVLCHRYIDAFPSRFYSLRWFGQYMDRFVAETAPYRNYPYLRELATLEWSFIEAFDAPDVPLATETTAAQIPAERWPQLRIQIHPSLHIFQYQWNILPVWKAIKEDETIPALIPLDKLQQCAVWRQELRTHYRTLDESEAVLLQAVNENADFAQLCECLLRLNRDNENVAMQAAGFLKTWINQGMISELQY